MKLSTHEPTVLIAPAAEQRIRHWVDLARGEVSGLGTVVVHDDGLLIDEVYLLEQECTGSHTELDDEAIAALLVELDAQGVDTGTVRFWWHSHGTMQSFWSTTDEACIAGLSNDTFTVSLVTNKRRQDLVRIDLLRPFAATIDHVPLHIDVEDLGLHELCEAEFRDKVEEIVLFSRHRRRQGDGLLISPFADPPWPHDPHDEDDGHLLIDTTDDWWDDDGWMLGADEQQLQMELDDPWNAAMALEVGR